MACCYSKTLPLNDSNIKSIKKCGRRIDVGEKKKKRKVPSLAHIARIYYIFGKKHFIVLDPFKKKKNSPTYQNCWKWLCHTPSGSCFSLAEKENIMFSAHFQLASHLGGGS